MNIIRANDRAVLELGYEGERNRTEVRFYYGDLEEEFPGGTVLLQVKRPGECTKYDILLSNAEDEEYTAVWTVSEYDCAIKGVGECQLIYSVEGVTAKRKIWKTHFDRSIEGSNASIPPDWEDIETRLLAAAEEVNTALENTKTYVDSAAENAERAANAAQQSAEYAERQVERYNNMRISVQTLPETSDATANMDHTDPDAPLLRLGIPRGATGPQGSLSAVGASEEQLPMADGQGGWEWTTPDFLSATDQQGDPITIPEVNDAETSQLDVWSSSKVSTELGKKIDKPSSNGSNGNVLVTDGNGNYTWENRQSVLTFDTAPVRGSSNPVISGGVYDALDGVLTPEHLNVTDVISTNHTLNINYCHIERIGKVILLTVSVTLTSDVPAFGVIASIAEGYRPNAQIWGRSFGIDFDITGSGNIRPLGGTIASGKSLQATIVYCAA